MKIIICGAGQVGFGIAERLSAEDNDVTVIDTSDRLVRAISDTLDVQGIVGHGAHPDVLERAGAADADMIIAVTFVDEVNMMACEVANVIFNIPTKIARVRAQPYLTPEYRGLFARDNTAIDVVISPEIAVGEMVLRRLALPGAFEAIYFADDRVVAMGIAVDDECPIVNTPLSQLTDLFPDLNALVVAIHRDGDLAMPHGDDQMLPGDHVYVIADQSQAMRTLGLFGHEEQQANRVLIGGGGNIGLYLARKLEERDSSIQLRIIEANRERAELIAEDLKRTVVLNGSCLDQDILREAGVRQADVFVALTNDDKVNVLSSLLAKQEGAEQAMCLISGMSLGPLVSSLGIESFIDPRTVTVSTILQHVRRGRIRGVHPIQGGAGEIIEAEALETSPMIGKPLREVELPEGVRLGAVVRGEEVIIPDGQTVIKPHDRVILAALRDQVKQLQHLFRVSLEYF
ncbi:MAG: Trk system potassium transporter TrkA [Rhizobiales bacterium]|nr:Trk system potassium transporter TrkA [Hyphomicrobiales bacterium]